MSMPEELRPIEWHHGGVRLIDQTRLPHELVWIETDDPAAIAEAITSMRIRGAPALGVAAGYALALAAQQYPGDSVGGLQAALDVCAKMIGATRPTARNLFWALERIQAFAHRWTGDAGGLREAVLDEALAIQREDIESCRRIGDFGAELVPERATILTHCNAGALATGGYGTALGVIRSAVAAGKQVQVLVDETRPLLQGARLTAWELLHDCIPATLIPDAAAGACMSRGMVDLVVVGADRIARSGDTANKIGTYSLAVLAHENGVPFYVAAPMSTVDLKSASAEDIPIEERAPEEVTEFAGNRVAPEGMPACNFAFDVTPARYIGAIITDRGVIRPPYGEGWPEPS
jgi:methylthioribose-1-phosphate isomerase